MLDGMALRFYILVRLVNGLKVETCGIRLDKSLNVPHSYLGSMDREVEYPIEVGRSDSLLSLETCVSRVASVSNA